MSIRARASRWRVWCDGRVAAVDVESIAISQVAHWTYCPRKVQVIAGEAGWLDNWHTTRGALDHARTHAPLRERRDGTTWERGLPVGSDAHGVHGVADLVVFAPGDPPLPVEFKRTKHPDDVARVQLTLIALCLEEMLGEEIPRAAVFSTGRRRRAEIEIDDLARADALDRLARVRAWLADPVLLPPRADRRCNGCSLEPRCLPFARARLGGEASP